MRTSVQPLAAKSALALAMLVLALDVATKRLAEQRLDAPVDLVLGARLDLSYNSGVAFGAFAGAPDVAVLVLVSGAAVLLVSALVRGWLPAGAIVVALLAGGAMANLIDRMPDGRVTDFVVLPLWPSFNPADVAITGAVVGLLLRALRRAGDDATDG